ncbi:hypothetical protein THRCLA_05364 [Thraustotheca clavata]|uniref:Uncharacterized protein n=1 Tax=Thraustotheca clavata TaxID=74557 RepID=A0A1V9ZW47_9STRA|nr:hypothetical protein THRCLA_05364 [Thraustotheca clavata]
MDSDDESSYMTPWPPPEPPPPYTPEDYMLPFFEIDLTFEGKLLALGSRSFHANDIKQACRDNVGAIDWSNTSVHHEQLIALSVYIGLTSRNLISLNLSHNLLGVNGAELLGKALLTNNTIEELNLSYTELTGNPFRTNFEGICILTKGFESPRSVLQDINLTEVGLQPNGVRLVCCALAFHRSLKVLSLARNQAGLFKEKQGCNAIANLLRYSTTLTILDISENPFQSSAGPELREALQCNRALATLYATNCNLSQALSGISSPTLVNLKL